MASLPADAELASWAREHLVYEAKMLAYTAVGLAKRRDLPRTQESNVFLEAFAIHTRCLREFLWGDRSRYPLDAFASDFCSPGRWEQVRGDVPRALREIDDRSRLGREVVHLSYARSAVPAEIKDWPVSEIVRELVVALDEFALEALPECLDEETRLTLTDLASSPPPGVGPVSVATAIQVPYAGARSPFPTSTSGVDQRLLLLAQSGTHPAG
jgi:hypothetical protein